MEVVRYISVNDFGAIVNPLLVEGQAHGGIAQGIGQALYESVAYSEDGQLLSGSYRITACRAPATCPTSASSRAPRPARPTRSAPRAAARRGARDRCRR